MGFRYFFDNLGVLVIAAGMLAILGLGFYFIYQGIVKREGVGKILLGIILILFAGAVLIAGYKDLSSENAMGATLWENLRQMFSAPPAP